MVIMVHSYIRFDIPNSLSFITRFGQMGCQIFYVISGFSLMLSCDRHQYGLKEFYKKRFWSIAIGYWLTIAIYALLAFGSLNFFGSNLLGTSIKGLDYLVNICLLQGVFPSSANNQTIRGGWYIGTLIILYLLFPWIRLLFKKYTPPLIMIVLSSICMMIIVIISMIGEKWYCGNNSFTYYSFINQLPSFLIGMSLYQANKEERKCKNSLLAGIILMTLSIYIFNSDLQFAFVIEPTLFSMSIYFLLIHALSRKSNKTYPKFLMKFGDLSYPIFLTHFFVVYEMASVVKIVAHRFVEFPEWIIYLCWLPIAYVIVYITAYIFNLLLKRIRVIAQI